MMKVPSHTDVSHARTILKTVKQVLGLIVRLQILLEVIEALLGIS